MDYQLRAYNVLKKHPDKGYKEKNNISLSESFIRKSPLLEEYNRLNWEIYNGKKEAKAILEYTSFEEKNKSSYVITKREGIYKLVDLNTEEEMILNKQEQSKALFIIGVLRVSSSILAIVKEEDISLCKEAYKEAMKQEFKNDKQKELYIREYMKLFKEENNQNKKSK